MSTSADSLGILTANLRSSQSFHPTLSLSLSSPSIPALSDTCEANLLLHLPPGLFYDPFTASNAIVGRESSSSRGTVVWSGGGGVELEQAVGWVGRSSAHREVEAGRQWWERKEAESEAAVDLHGILGSVLRDTAQEAVQLSLDQGHRIKVDSHQHWEAKEERTTVVVPIDIDALLNAPDAFRLDVPLHVRYHPPTARSATSSSTDSLGALLKDLLPKSATDAYERLRQPPPKPTHTPYATTTLPAPTIYIACSSADGKPPASLLPASHAHLRAQFGKSGLGAGKRVVAQTKAEGARGLRVRVPVPMEAWWVAVQWATLVTVVGAAGGVGWKLCRVVGWLEEVEKGW